MDKKMITKRFFPIVVAVMLAVALVIPGAAVAAEATATRTLPASVDAGADFTVGIEASGCGSMGQVVETLPTGFSYVGTESTDVNVTQDGNAISFTFMGGGVAFDYTVTASATEGSYSFSGIVKDEDLNQYTTVGDTDITIIGSPAEGAIATRTLPASVDAGADFTVGIEASGCGSMGQVVETLPTGFSYVGTESTDVNVTQDGNTVSFSFMGDSVTFDYTVTASATEGSYSFSGIVKDEDLNEVNIGGETGITVGPTPEPPPEVELEFSGTLAQDETDVLATVPAGATELEITLSATADLDLNLYDGDTFVIGWNAAIDSKGPTTGTYEGDTFTYSGWNGREEYINSDGPLSQAYTLKVYGFDAGGYTVTVSYVTPGPDVDPPTVTITAPDATVGTPTTIEVAATDPSGVMLLWFGVWPEEYPEEWSNGEHPMATICTFTNEASLTFTPGWAGTYTVEAVAADKQDNVSEAETTTFVVSE